MSVKTCLNQTDSSAALGVQNALCQIAGKPVQGLMSWGVHIQADWEKKKKRKILIKGNPYNKLSCNRDTYETCNVKTKLNGLLMDTTCTQHKTAAAKPKWNELQQRECACCVKPFQIMHGSLTHNWLSTKVDEVFRSFIEVKGAIRHNQRTPLQVKVPHAEVVK